MIGSFEEALAFLYPRTAGGTKWSLQPTSALLEQVGNPHRHFPAVHIGGTNGKGSVAVMVFEVLRRAGWKVGLYTSPHLVDLRERIVVCGEPISADAFTMWTRRLYDGVEATGASFFEVTTAIAFADFAARGVDVAVIEVGLGGRLDSTNVIDPLVSAVTSVAREHVEYLGSSLQGIAREKAGIAKPGRPFVIGETNPELADTLRQVAERAGAAPVLIPGDAEYARPLAFEGRHQRRNAVVACEVLAQLPDDFRPSDGAIAAGLAEARLPGRLDRRGKWIFDVAHNPAGMATLVEALRDLALPGPVHAVVGILGDKDWRSMLILLNGAVERIWVTRPPSTPPERRWDPAEVARAIPDVIVEPDFDRALAGAHAEGKSIVVTGSFHTVGDAMSRLPGFRPLG